MEQALINSELFRFLVQVVILTAGVVGAYYKTSYKVRESIEAVDIKVDRVITRVSQIESDRNIRWAKYEATMDEHRKCLEEINKNVANTMVKVDLLLQNKIKFEQQR